METMVCTLESPGTMCSPEAASFRYQMTNIAPFRWVDAIRSRKGLEPGRPSFEAKARSRAIAEPAEALASFRQREGRGKAVRVTHCSKFIASRRKPPILDDFRLAQ